MTYFDDKAFFAYDFSTSKFIEDTAKEAFHPTGRASLEDRLIACIENRKEMYSQLAQVSSSACMRAIYEEINIKHFVPSKVIVVEKMTSCMKSDEEISTLLRNYSPEIDYYTALHMIAAYKPALIKRYMEFTYDYIKGKFYEKCRDTVKNYLGVSW